jgi:hypothetical protein
MRIGADVHLAIALNLYGGCLWAVLVQARPQSGRCSVLMRAPNIGNACCKQQTCEMQE